MTMNDRSGRLPVNGESHQNDFRRASVVPSILKSSKLREDQERGAV
jgi:hypothetical protein